jgi:hypothetical protein
MGLSYLSASRSAKGSFFDAKSTGCLDFDGIIFGQLLLGKIQ